MELIYRYPYNGEKQWLKVTKKTHVDIREGRKFAEHGSLVDTAMAGNGYHGRCANCGLALVTDLGYTSWNDTKCVMEPKKTITVTYNLTWHKSKDRASKLDPDEAQKHFSDLIHEQGWGTYNFQRYDLSD